MEMELLNMQKERDYLTRLVSEKQAAVNKYDQMILHSETAYEKVTKDRNR